MTTALSFILPFVSLLLLAPDTSFYLGSPDHGFQLSMGRQVTLGKFPFIDFYSHYGPLTAFTSAVGIWIWDSLMSETLICVAGYSLAISLIYRITAGHTSRLWGFIAATAGFLALARFYKWYYWLFPLLALYAYSQIVRARRSDANHWYLAAGLCDGVAALYRLDLGLACFFSHLFCFVLMSFVAEEAKPRRRQLAGFVCASLVPVAVWLVALVGAGGLSGMPDYFSAQFTGARDIVTDMSKAPPVLLLSDPLSKDSLSALAILMVPLTYFLAFLWVIYSFYAQSEIKADKVLVTMASVVLGAAVLPQALYRPDNHHLLQVLPPALIAGSMLLSELWKSVTAASAGSFRRVCGAGLGVTYLLCAALAFLGTRSERAYDLAWSEVPSWNRYQRLAGWGGRGPAHPVGAVVDELEKLTNEADTILVFGNCPQIYYFSKRAVAGLLTFYVAGLFGNEECRARDLEVIQRKRPSVVVVPESFVGTSAVHDLTAHRPELAAFVCSTYPVPTYRSPDLAVLKPLPDYTMVPGEKEPGRVCSDRPL